MSLIYHPSDFFQTRKKFKFPLNIKDASQASHMLHVVFINKPCKEGKDETTLLFPKKETGEDVNILNTVNCMTYKIMVKRI